MASAVLLVAGTSMFLVYGTMLDTPVTSFAFVLGLLALTYRPRRSPHPAALGLVGFLTAVAGWLALLVVGTEVLRAAIGARAGRRRWRDAAGERRMGQADVLVVTPYNAQVNRVRAALAAAGLGDVEVGTVDRFQGREAAVSVLTLAASSGAHVPRRLDFLLDRHRLNVALSRAKTVAYLVASPALLTSPVQTPEKA